MCYYCNGDANETMKFNYKLGNFKENLYTSCFLCKGMMEPRDPMTNIQHVYKIYNHCTKQNINTPKYRDTTVYYTKYKTCDANDFHNNCYYCGQENNENHQNGYVCTQACCLFCNYMVIPHLMLNMPNDTLFFNSIQKIVNNWNTLSFSSIRETPPILSLDKIINVIRIQKIVNNDWGTLLKLNCSDSTRGNFMNGFSLPTMSPEKLVYDINKQLSGLRVSEHVPDEFKISETDLVKKLMEYTVQDAMIQEKLVYLKDIKNILVLNKNDIETKNADEELMTKYLDSEIVFTTNNRGCVGLGKLKKSYKKWCVVNGYETPDINVFVGFVITKYFKESQEWKFSMYYSNGKKIILNEGWVNCWMKTIGEPNSTLALPRKKHDGTVCYRKWSRDSSKYNDLYKVI